VIPTEQSKIIFGFFFQRHIAEGEKDLNVIAQMTFKTDTGRNTKNERL